MPLADHNYNLESKNQTFKKGLRSVDKPHLALGDKLHHKFAVIDNKKVITGSFNWSPAAAHINDEILLLIHSPELTEHIIREIDHLWNTTKPGITPHVQHKLDR